MARISLNQLLRSKVSAEDGLRINNRKKPEIVLGHVLMHNENNNKIISL